jgi:hypothetical protein
LLFVNIPQLRRIRIGGAVKSKTGPELLDEGDKNKLAVAESAARCARYAFFGPGLLGTYTEGRLAIL